MKQHVPCTDVATEALYLRSCIGAIRRPQLEHMQDAEQRLDPSDFHSDSLRALAELVWRRVDAKQPVWKAELKTAAPKLADEIDRVLSDHGENEQPAHKLAEHLRALARRRRKYEALSRAAAALCRGEEEAADEHVLTVASEQIEQRNGEYLDASGVVIAAAEELRRAKEEGDGRRLGFPLLDRPIRSLRAQTMFVVGGVTGAGKSSFMLAAAVNQARRGLPVGIISLEDSEAVWGERLYAHCTDADLARASDVDVDRASREAARLPIHFAIEIGRPLRDVLRAMRHLVRQHGCRIIYVDYVQAIQDSARMERKRHIAHAASSIKAQAAELGAAVVLGSQVSRPSKEKPFGEIFTSDLKESGDLENMAEGVILLWKTGDEEHSPVRGKLAKLKWSPARPRFQLQRSAAGSIVGLIPQLQPAAAERDAI